MKKKLSLLLLVLVVLATCVLSTGCYDNSVREESAYQQKLAQQASDKIGMPEITNFYMKGMLKQIYEKCDDSKLICYAYSQNMDGKFVYIGKCMGYGIPYSTQYTNPETPYFGGDDNDGVMPLQAFAIPQQDPDGLYRSSSTDATWVMMIDEETGENYIMDFEPNIVTTEHKMPARLCESWSLPANY